jgi:hypothetical protein
LSRHILKHSLAFWSKKQINYEKSKNHVALSCFVCSRWWVLAFKAKLSESYCKTATIQLAGGGFGCPVNPLAS